MPLPWSRARAARSRSRRATNRRGHGHRHSVVAEVGVELRVWRGTGGSSSRRSRGRAGRPARRHPAWGTTGRRGSSRGRSRCGRRRAGNCAVNAMSSVTAAPGATGFGSTTRATVRSSGVAIVGRLEAERARQIGAVGEGQRGDVDPAPAVAAVDGEPARLAARLLPEGANGCSEARSDRGGTRGRRRCRWKDCAR